MLNVTTEMNTHAVFKNLKNHGFTEAQAEGITEAVSMAALNPATKEQVNNYGKEITNVKQDITDIKKDTVDIKQDIVVIKIEIDQIKNTMATKSDLTELRNELKGEIAELRNEVKQDIADLKIDMLKWTIPFFVTIIIGVFIPLFVK